MNNQVYTRILFCEIWFKDFWGYRVVESKARCVVCGTIIYVNVDRSDSSEIKAAWRGQITLPRFWMSWADLFAKILTNCFNSTVFANQWIFCLVIRYLCIWYKYKPRLTVTLVVRAVNIVSHLKRKVSTNKIPKVEPEISASRAIVAVGQKTNSINYLTNNTSKRPVNS